MENFLEVLSKVVVFAVCFALLALANRELYEQTIAKLLVDPLFLKFAGSSDRATMVVNLLKRLQPLLVVLLAYVVSQALGQPLTAILTQFAPDITLSDPTLTGWINAVLIAVGAFKVHQIEERKEQVRSEQRKLADLHAETQRITNKQYQQDLARG